MKKIEFKLNIPSIGETRSLTLTVDYKRMIFYGGAKQSSHNATFLNAANNTNKDYGADKVKTEDFIAIKSAATIVDKINDQSENTVQSIDIFCHGGRDELYFAHKEWAGDNDLYKNQKEESKDANYPWNDSKTLNDIDYSVFTNNAKIEIHGCNTGSYDEGKDSPFAEVLSKKLKDAGKTKVVVVAHVDSANPNMHKSLKGDDYRHGGRRIFHNGKELFFTRKEGRITGAEINKHLN